LVQVNGQSFWVKLNYGLWSNGFVWRYPRSGFIESFPIANSNIPSKSFSYGRKQLYYLNSIESKSHTLLFIKNNRFDYPSISKQDFPINIPNFTLANYDHSSFTQHQLCLTKILLISKEKLTPGNLSMASTSPIGTIRQVGAFRTNVTATNSFYHHTFSYGFNFESNILDVNDVSSIVEDLNSKSEKSIDFEFDYTLRPNSTFGNANLLASLNSNYGALTLKKIRSRLIKGTFDKDVTFTYHNNPNYIQNSARNDWGFWDVNQSAWSLTQVEENSGLKFNVYYQDNTYSKNLFLNDNLNNLNHPSGNVRVSRISFNDNNSIFETYFDYGIPGTNHSSGTLFYKPNPKEYVPFSFFFPGGQVYYEFVKTSHFNSLNQLKGSVLNKFLVPKLIINNPVASQHSPASIHIDKLFSLHQTYDSKVVNSLLRSLSQTTIHNRMSSLGVPLEISTFDEDNRLLAKRTYNYNLNSPQSTP
jgi:hypothetical protein